MSSTLQINTAAFARRPGARPYVLGHRGFPRAAAENTIASFQSALVEGADGVELDVRMSTDGSLVLSHDDLIFEGAGSQSKRSLEKLTLEQIRKLRGNTEEPFATLRDALTFQARTGALLNVELKGNVPAPRWMARKAAEEIRPHGGKNIILSSFSPTIVRALRRHLPEIPCCLLVEAKHGWLAPWIPLEILGVQGVNPEWPILKGEWVQRLKKKGQLLSAWTVNDPDDALRLAELGVDVLISDAPGPILEVLRKRYPESGPSPYNPNTGS